MSKDVQVQVDHFGVFTKEPNQENVFFQLGFRAAGGSETLTPGKNGTLPSCLHMVMDNGYIEYMLSWPQDFGPCKNGQKGLAYFEIEMADGQRTRNSLEAKGIPCTDVITASRYADHGMKKGEAIFECTNLVDEILPNIMLGGVCHKTKELFYDNERFQHKNGVSRIEEIDLFFEDRRRFDEMKEKTELAMAEFGEFPPQECVRDLRLMQIGEAQSAYGVTIPAGATNTAAIVLKTDDLKAATDIVKASGYTYHLADSQCVVDLTRELGLILVFRA